MNEKPTYELDKILSSVEPEHFNRYRNEEDTDSQMSVSEFFNRYIGSYGLQLSDVIRQSDIPANYAYGILNGNRTNPSRDRVIALCIACHMNLTDTNRALKTAGLSPLYSKVSRELFAADVHSGAGGRRGLCYADHQRHQPLQLERHYGAGHGPHDPLRLRPELRPASGHYLRSAGCDSFH